MDKQPNQPHDDMADSLYNWVATADTKSLYLFMLACIGQKPPLSSESSLPETGLQPSTFQPHSINFHNEVSNVHIQRSNPTQNENPSTSTAPKTGVFPLYLSENDYLQLSDFSSDEMKYQHNSSTTYALNQTSLNDYQAKQENKSRTATYSLDLSNQNYLDQINYQPTIPVHQPINKAQKPHLENTSTPKEEHVKSRKNKHRNPYPGTSSWNYLRKENNLATGETIMDFTTPNNTQGIKRKRTSKKKEHQSTQSGFFSQQQTNKDTEKKSVAKMIKNKK